MHRQTLAKINFLILAVLFFVLSARAQTLPSSADFGFEVIPQISGPNTETSVIIRSYSFDLDQSFFTWTLNGQRVLEGKARKSLVFRTGETGSRSVIRVIITTGYGQRLDKTLTLRVADVDLLWQSSGYAPPWYKGKTLISPGSSLKIFALPQGFSAGNRAAPNQNLIYNWSVNGNSLIPRSGLGKYSLTLQVPPEERGENTVKVLVKNTDESVAAEKTFVFTIKEPKIVFYEEHPLEGTRFQKAVSSLDAFSGQNLKIKAEPYYFPKEELNNLSFEWTANGSPIRKIGRRDIFEFSSLQGLAGSIPIQLTIKNIKDAMFQFISSQFIINVQ